MPVLPLTTALRTEYERLFVSCEIRAERQSQVEACVVQIAANRPRYLSAASLSGVPWFFIAVVHNMESSLSFTRHLHNGDPLTARTVHVPAGRPRTGQPPFTWEFSAADALAMKGLGAQTDWSLSGLIYQLERYNGFGYRMYHPHVLSPYLWSFSSHYTSGKYVADGTFSETAVSKQVGAAVLLRRMAEANLVEFEDQPLPDGLLIPPFATRKSRNAELVRRAEELQRWLNTFRGIFVKVDGVPGERTSDAYRAVTGHRLPKDPRA